MILKIIFPGDMTAGIPPAYFDVPCPFERGDIEDSEMQSFKEEVMVLYRDYGGDNCFADYDWEIEEEANKYMDAKPPACERREI